MNNYDKNADWNSWSKPDEKELIKMANIITKHIKFINPKIVDILIKDNNQNFPKWEEEFVLLQKETSHYFWKNSPCTFPGVRRKVGSKEKRRTTIKDLNDKSALYIDDNDYPKHLWSFIFTGKKFSNVGPDKYSLAHILDHKDYKNRIKSDFNITDDVQTVFHGLFSAVTNTCFIPEELIDPTDFDSNLRKLIFYKALDLYGDIANLLPYHDSKLYDIDDLIPKQNSNDVWHINNFEWSDPVGTIENMDAFLKFRKDEVEKWINKIKASNDIK